MLSTLLALPFLARIPSDRWPTTVVKQLFQCGHCHLRFICIASKPSRRWFDPRTIQPKEGKIVTSSQDNKTKLKGDGILHCTPRSSNHIYRPQYNCCRWLLPGLASRIRSFARGIQPGESRPAIKLFFFSVRLSL